MNATARDFNSDPASTEGLEDLFPQGVLEHAEESSITQQGVLPEAAAIHLGLSVSGVLKRLRRGNLKGFKVPSKRGTKWLVCPTELPEGVLRNGKDSCLSNEGVLALSEESSEESLNVNEESSLLPTEVDWENQDCENDSSLGNSVNIDVAELLRKLEGATYRIGYLESKLEDREKEIKLLTDSQHKPSWWSRLSSWFSKAQ